MLFDGPQCYGEWCSAVITIAANAIATRVIHASDINTADFGMVGDVMSETTVGVRGTSEGALAG